MKRVLGLDLGTNSIGWAVVDVPDGVEDTGAVVAMGSRIFTQGAEEAGSALVTPAKERRQKRSMRRQIARRAKRRCRIREELTRVGFLPEDDGAFDALMDADPQALLKRSTNGEELTLREIGRVIYWFSSKRGFLSLRSEGADLTDDDDERAARPRYRRPQVHSETGEVVHDGQEDLLVGFLRDQAGHHPDLITDHLIFGNRGRLTYPVRPISRDRFMGDGTWLDEFGIHGLVFFQRSIYWDEKTIGRCSIDPSHGGPRALRADRLAQKYRVWKTIVDLRVGLDERPLTSDERETTFDALMSQGTLAFTALRRRLRLPDDSPINFERSERTNLKGNETDAAMRKALGSDHWNEMPEGARDRMVMLLLGDAQEEQVRATLTGEYGLDDDQVAGCVAARFPGGRAMFGRRTLRRLHEVLPECDTERDAIEIAGFPMPEVVRRERPVVVSELTNPLVRQTLSQLRKVLHAVAHAYGRDGDTPFDVVRIELSRDVRANRRDREQTNKFQRANEQANKDAEGFIEEYGQGSKANRDRRRRHRLWTEQKEQCLYCGQPISATSVLSSATELDHILPRSRTLDDSLANMALVHADENREKGNRTITEWAGPDKAAEVAERVLKASIPWAHKKPKLRRIEAVDVADAPVPEALIVQTGYINSVARDFVRQELGIEAEVSSGRITAQLRYRIGLHKDDEDHRRHALDAAMVSICDISTARKLADRFRRERDFKVRRDDEYGSWEPWDGLRDDIKANYEAINVSHAVKGKVSGQLHEETRYGKVLSPYRNGEEVWALRRPLSAITSAKRIGEVADPVVRAALVEDLQRRGVDPNGTGLVFDDEVPPVLPDGSVVRSVRCHLNRPGNTILQPDSEPRTGVAVGRNHSAYIFENVGTGKWRMEIVQRLEAFSNRATDLSTTRLRYKREDERFLFSVTIGASLLMEVDGEDSLYRVQSLAPSLSALDVRPAHESGGSRQAWHRASKLQRLDARKVVVLPSGELRTARD